MPFKGNLRDNLDGMVEIANGSLDTTSMEVTFLNQNGTAIRRIFAASIPAGAVIQYPLHIRRLNPSRMIIDLEIPVGGQGTARVVQGAFATLDDFVQDIRLVFDLIPAA